nr:unnamed protein product [Callosobruchus analis]
MHAGDMGIDHIRLATIRPKSDTCSTCHSEKSNEEHQENVKLGFELMSRNRENALKNDDEC